MKTGSADVDSEPKGHVCPPSNATHPRDRWESLFVYGFICRFTTLRGKVEGLDSPMNFEEALMNDYVDPVMTQILSRFVLNLKPQTRNLSSDVISASITALFQEHVKGTDRGVFWNDELKINEDPLLGVENGFWGAPWDLKLRVLRQLVELQLCHSNDIKKIIDRAWGVVHNKHKKAEMTATRPPADDPQSQENLQLVPLGQDLQRKRYWVIDDSPRVYVSTNPWKITSSFQAVSSDREEYVALVAQLKELSPPPSKSGEKGYKKTDLNHIHLVQALEDRLPAIDAEIARIQRAQKRIAQRNILIAQAEIRETRTRRRTTRPDYAYLNDPIEEDEQDEYKFQEEEEEDDQFEDDELAGNGPAAGRRRVGTRRSTRAAANGTKPEDEWADWRVERRSARLGAPAETQVEKPPAKRARTEESGTASSREGSAPTGPGGIKFKGNGAAAVKPTEMVVEAVAGKKKSKFWVYAVEPIAQAQVQPPVEDVEMAEAGAENGHLHGGSLRDDASSVGGRDGIESQDVSIPGSSSPEPSMDDT
ncbi:hypothetical protein PsYK624_019010 [Phanerochaete sordida]|uniref:WHIM1 domain-containing protein n=1 Tax=Phanerochaete sordida TaxID=48140 RepID=A0A9P3FYY7_9APHY|nr:hypothetical protein PsYK624_019010 [Phanerochaete sordida]